MPSDESDASPNIIEERILQSISVSQLRNEFKKVDSKKKGVLTKRVFEDTIGNIVEDLSPSEIKILFAEYAVDGHIHYLQFCEALQKVEMTTTVHDKADKKASTSDNSDDNSFAHTKSSSKRQSTKPKRRDENFGSDNDSRGKGKPRRTKGSARERLHKESMMKQSIRRKMAKGMAGETNGFRGVQNEMWSVDTNETGLINERSFFKILCNLKSPLTEDEAAYLAVNLKSKTSKKEIEHDRLAFLLSLTGDEDSSVSEHTPRPENAGLGANILRAEQKLGNFLSKDLNGESGITGADILQESLERLDRKENNKLTGKLSQKDFHRALSDAGMSLDHTSLRLILSKFSKDKNSLTSYVEFLRRYHHNPVGSAAMRKVRSYFESIIAREGDDALDPLRSIRIEFEKKDKRRNGMVSGVLSVDDFGDVLNLVGLKLTMEQILSIAKQYVTPKQRVVDYLSFLRGMMSSSRKVSQRRLPSTSRNDQVKKIIQQYLRSSHGKHNESGGEVAQSTLEAADRMRHQKLTGCLSQRDFLTVLATIGLNLSSREQQVLMCKLTEEKIKDYDSINYIHFLRYFEEDEEIELGITQTVQNMQLNDLHFGVRGSVGEWLALDASKVDKKNFEEFIMILSEYEKKIGLRLKSRSVPPPGDHLVIQLGAKLKVALKFYI